MRKKKAVTDLFHPTLKTKIVTWGYAEQGLEISVLSVSTILGGEGFLGLCGTHGGGIHRIVESQNGLGWKGPYRSSGSNPPAMSRDIFH